MTILCPRCKGTGQVWDSVAVNPLIVVFTLGFSLIDSKERCGLCRGKGTVKVEN